MGFQSRLSVIKTSMQVTMPSVVKRPSAGDQAYRVAVAIRNGRGEMEAPDGATIYARVTQSDGTVDDAFLYEENALSTALANSANGNFASGSGWEQQDNSISTGLFELFLRVQSTTNEIPYTLELGWDENGQTNYHNKRFQIGDAADLDTIQSDTDDIQSTLGTPAGASVSADIATMDANVDAILVDTADMQPKLGTPAGASISADIATMDANVDALLVDVGDGTDAESAAGVAGSLHSKLRAVLADTADMQPKLGTPAGASISADIATVDANIDAILVDTADMQPKLGTPAGASISADIATIDANVDALLVDTGDGTDAETTAGAAGSLHSKLRAILADTADMQPRVGVSVLEPFTNITTDGLGNDTFRASGLGTFVDNFYDGMIAIVYDASEDDYVARRIKTYTGATKQILLHQELPFTPSDLTPDQVAIVAADDYLSLVLGESGDASTADTLHGLVGQPGDAAADATSGAEGSVFAYLRDISTAVDGVAAGSGCRVTSFNNYVVNADAELTADPTIAQVSADGTANASANFEVMHIHQVTFPETTSAVIDSLFATLHWSSQITTGSSTGSTKWMISPIAITETLGSAPSGSAVDITDDVAASTLFAEHTRSGQIPSSAIPATNGFNLILCGQPAVNAEVVTSTIYEDSSLEINYHC